MELSKNMLIIVLWFLTIFVATILALHLASTTFDTYEVVFDEVSAMGNNGMSIGYMTPDSPHEIKWIYIFLMWIGRLEIIPVLILFMGFLSGFETHVSGK